MRKKANLYPEQPAMLFAKEVTKAAHKTEWRLLSDKAANHVVFNVGSACENAIERSVKSSTRRNKKS